MEQFLKKYNIRTEHRDKDLLLIFGNNTLELIGYKMGKLWNIGLVLHTDIPMKYYT